MAYPDAWSGGRNPDTEDISLREEVLPRDAFGNPLPSDNPMLHFDLDSSNGESIMEAVRGRVDPEGFESVFLCHASLTDYHKGSDDGRL